MTPFQSIATAIAAQVGTGNLAGAATALIGGGPGAIFWMWVSAFLGMATIYAEAVLAQTYKTEVNGEVTGGPVYYIKAAFKGTFGKVLSTLFAVFIVLALGFMEIWFSPIPSGSVCGSISGIPCGTFTGDRRCYCRDDRSGDLPWRNKESGNGS